MIVLADLFHEFHRHKSLADQALARLDDAAFFRRPGERANPVALIVKHIAGNFLSRWTDFLTSDGDKASRDRDSEFVLKEEDTRANDELRLAVDAALDVLRGLGATTEDVRVRPLHEYYSVRVMLTESELFARHQHNLCTRASDYGHHFLGRTLAASLFSSADYIAAQRKAGAL